MNDKKIYADAKKELADIIRNDENPHYEEKEINVNGTNLMTFHRPGDDNKDLGGRFTFWIFSGTPESEGDESCTLDNQIKKFQKALDSFQRYYNNRCHNKKQEDKETMGTQECFLHLSEHRELLPLIRDFLATQTRMYPDEDELYDFWLYIAEPKNYKKLKPYIEQWQRNRYGNTVRVKAKPKIGNVNIKKMFGFEPFVISKYAFERVPEAWWHNMEDSTPVITKYIAECKAVKTKLDGNELPPPPQYIVLSLFD